MRIKMFKKLIVSKFYFLLLFLRGSLIIKTRKTKIYSTFVSIQVMVLFSLKVNTSAKYNLVKAFSFGVNDILQLFLKFQRQSRIRYYSIFYYNKILTINGQLLFESLTFNNVIKLKQFSDETTDSNVELKILQNIHLNCQRNSNFNNNMLLYLEYFGYLTQERFKCVEFTENFQEWLDKDCYKGFLLFLHKNQIPGSSVISRCVLHRIHSYRVSQKYPL